MEAEASLDKRGGVDLILEASDTVRLHFSQNAPLKKILQYSQKDEAVGNHPVGVGEALIGLAKLEELLEGVSSRGLLEASVEIIVMGGGSTIGWIATFNNTVDIPSFLAFCFTCSMCFKE